VSVKITFSYRTFAVIQILDNFGSLTIYFLGAFNETFGLFFHARINTDVPSFVEKYKQIKYAIFDLWTFLNLLNGSY
jgi:hypothetical protein